MGWKDCQIILSSSWNSYYSGQSVNGTFLFTLKAPTKMRGIRIKFHGSAHTQWIHLKHYRDREGTQHSRPETLYGDEEFLNNQYYLLGSKNSAEIELPAGQHTCDFKCALPLTLPSSFEGKWGHIRYGIEITLDRKWKFNEHSRLAFVVISTLDLNRNPESKESFYLDMEKCFWCFCCRSGSLSLLVSLPVTGYLPGQSIPIVVEWENASSVKVNEVIFILHQVVVFQTQWPRWDQKSVAYFIAGFSVGPLEKHQSHTFRENLDIPNSPPLNSADCYIINIRYELKVIAKVSFFHRNLKGKIPIVLGTIPFVSDPN